jgi:hypothetical protein
MGWGRAPGQGWGGRLGGAVSRVAIRVCDALRQCVGRYRDERPAMPRWENLFHNDDAGIFRSSGQAWFRDIHNCTGRLSCGRTKSQQAQSTSDPRPTPSYSTRPSIQIHYDERWHELAVRMARIAWIQQRAFYKWTTASTVPLARVPSCRGRTDSVISLSPRLRRTLIGTFSLSFTDGCLMTIVLP